MLTITDDQKISNLTVGQLKSLVQEAFLELIDPDYGLELRPEIEASLKESRESNIRIPVEKVAEELGLKW